MWKLNRQLCCRFPWEYTRTNLIENYYKFAWTQHTIDFFIKLDPYGSIKFFTSFLKMDQLSCSLRVLHVMYLSDLRGNWWSWWGFSGWILYDLCVTSISPRRFLLGFEMPGDVELPSFISLVWKKDTLTQFHRIDLQHFVHLCHTGRSWQHQLHAFF